MLFIINEKNIENKNMNIKKHTQVNWQTESRTETTGFYRATGWRYNTKTKHIEAKKSKG